MIEWFDRKPGSNVTQGSEDPTMLLIGDGPPDWVRLPPELGGARVRVLGSHTAPCPMCEGDAPVRHLELGNDLFVAECAFHGFAWYRKRAE